MALVSGLVAAQVRLLRVLQFARGVKHVLRQVDQHRARPAGGGYVEGLLYYPLEGLYVLYEVVVLGAGPRYADYVGLLEGVVADKRRGHLPGENNHGDRVHVGRGNAGDRVRGPRPRRDDDDAGPARGPRVPVGHVDRALLVPHQYVPHGRVEERVVDGQHRASGEAEYRID